MGQSLHEQLRISQLVNKLVLITAATAFPVSFKICSATFSHSLILTFFSPLANHHFGWTLLTFATSLSPKLTIRTCKSSPRIPPHKTNERCNSATVVHVSINYTNARARETTKSMVKSPPNKFASRSSRETARLLSLKKCTESVQISLTNCWHLGARSNRLYAYFCTSLHSSMYVNQPKVLAAT